MLYLSYMLVIMENSDPLLLEHMNKLYCAKFLAITISKMKKKCKLVYSFDGESHLLDSSKIIR